ncbi:MAG: hypothetical protein E7354_00245 [Clostridiales bacterium]|nr:hypothetical protein [Clostridiales bacterium]
MKIRKVVGLIVLVFMMMFSAACSSSLQVDYDLTKLDGVTMTVGEALNTETYQSKYKNKVFKVRGKHFTSGEDYHYLTVKDGVCCDFDIEIRLADDSISYPDTNKNVIVIATYTYVPQTSTSSSTFYLSVAEFK